ncbi:hypothetical protein psyc5s11_44630 [Clostridium gelidum]|uniref:Uncharacterized protein n=1 Tax=Clostridium gelidum TaxID=704125 RepID=A0ABM7T8U8_9CLOT|nr:hypothetical protein [Clostridium gelidum]BCZ48396.1 hypothetical protein psyc5s11_44630 [Clostridium gelidum]
MGCDDELLITYGLGYAFERSKLLIITEIEEKTVLKHEINIIEEINSINKFKEKLDRKCNLKFPSDYIINIEEALEERLLKTIPIITSIKFKNMDKQSHIMEEYIKRDLNQVRLRKEGYIQKDSTLVKEYLDNCSKNLEINAKDTKQKLLKYNKIILKVILTTSFGTEFSKFLSKHGQASIISRNDKLIEEQLEYEIRNNFLIKKKYSELDFLNLLLFLEEWQKKYFLWDEKYTSLMFSIDKNGKKYKGSKSELKDFMISFIKGKKYLYFPFGKYNESNICITLNDEKYQNNTKKKESDTKLDNKQSKMILEKKENNLYEIMSINYKEIDLEYNKEIGYLLSYSNDQVYISVVTYDLMNHEVSYVNKFEVFKTKMMEALEKYFII